MSEYLPYDKMIFGTNVKLEDISKIPDDSDIGYFFEVDLNYPDIIKEKTKHFPFRPEKKINPDVFSDYLKTVKTDICTETKQLMWDWSDKKNYLIHYRLLKLYVKRGMKVEKVHNVISFKQSEWLEKYISFNTQKRNKARKVFEKDLYKSLNNSFYGKPIENLRNRIKGEFIR